MGRILNATMVPLLREGKPMEAVEACTRELMNRMSQIKKRPTRRTFLEVLRMHLPEVKRKAALVSRIWINVPLGPRLIMSAIAVLLWCTLVSMLVNLGQALIEVIRFIEKAWLRHDMKGGRQALVGILNAVLRIVQAAMIIRIILTGSDYFLGGSGMFGGGGVNVFW